ncbi:hypothetical protein TNCV_4041951 [Trichonephila clavipes]|nr:hypothetical protein TNCV_4041951 [Trichonephila clavipes]
MGGEFTFGYCSNISKGKTIGILRGISSLLGKGISMFIAEDVYMDWHPLLRARFWGCNYSINKDNYILGRWTIVPLDRLECRSRIRTVKCH